jgi:hypothetical protein
VHLQVDAALIAQLRSGLGALRSSGAKVIGAPFVANVADTPRGYARQFPHYLWIMHRRLKETGPFQNPP